MVLTDEDRKLAAATREFKQRWREGITDTSPVPVETPVVAPITPTIAPLDRMERLLEQQVRIKSMMKFMRDMDTEAPTPTEKKSDLEMFEQFTKIQNQLTSASEKQEERLRERILDSISEDNIAPESTEDVLLKTLMGKLADGSVPIMKQTQQGASTAQLPPNILPPQDKIISNQEPLLGSAPPVGTNAMLEKTDAEIIKDLPPYIISAIKEGGINLEQIELGFSKQGVVLTTAEKTRIAKLYKKIQSKK